jgi:hypothetical protein
MAYRRGQPLMCIKDDWYHPSGIDPEHRLPRAGVIYRFREYDAGDPEFIRLMEISNPLLVNGHEVSFWIEHFRPLTERKNDGEAFVEQLKRDCIPSPTKANEREGVE